MKKTIEKLFKDSKFLEQIKSTPKQVKMFFGGLLVIVVAVAFVLPSISGKSLQGSVLNLGFSTSNKVDGYGYSYQPLGKCFLIEDNNEIKISCPKTSSTYPQELIDAYNYAYEMGFITTSIDNTPLGGTILEGESINILNIFADKFDLQEINQPGEPSNNEATRSFFIIKLVKMVWPANYSNNQEIYAKAKSEGLISSTNPEQLADPQVRVYAYKLLKVVDAKLSQQNNICQTPENVLACELMLNECPQQCRPVQCTTPENVLACMMNIDTCPQECRFGWNGNQTGTQNTISLKSSTIDETIVVKPGSEETIMEGTIRSVLPANIKSVKFFATGNIDMINNVSFQTKLNGNWITQGMSEGYGYGEFVFNNIEINNELEMRLVVEYNNTPNIYGTVKFTNLGGSNMSVYDNASNIHINNISGKIYSRTHQINKPLPGDTVGKEEPAIVEEVVPQVKEVVEEVVEKELLEDKVVEEVSEEKVEEKVEEESADSMMEMIQNLLK